MNGKDCDKQDDRQRNTRDRNKSPDEHRKAATQLDRDRHSSKQRWYWRPKGMQDGGERIWPACKLRVAVLNEPVANHQTKRYRIPGPSIGRRRRHVEGEHRHYSPSNGGHAKPASRLQRSWLKASVIAVSPVPCPFISKS